MARPNAAFAYAKQYKADYSAIFLLDNKDEVAFQIKQCTNDQADIKITSCGEWADRS